MRAGSDVSLKDLLGACRIEEKPRKQVTFDGLDQVRCWVAATWSRAGGGHAMDGEVMLAYRDERRRTSRCLTAIR